MDFGFDVITLAAMTLAASGILNPDGPVPQHDSILTGQIYYNELMTTRNTHRFRNVARMDRPTFLSLLDLLSNQSNLRNSMFMTAGEKLLIFIHALVGFSNRQLAERWQHSGSTISIVLHDVAESLILVKHLFFQVPKAEDPPQVAGNAKFSQVERRRMPSSVFRTKANDEGENRDFQKHLRRFFPSNVKSRKSFAKVFSFEHFKLEILRRF